VDDDGSLPAIFDHKRASALRDFLSPPLYAVRHEGVLKLISSFLHCTFISHELQLLSKNYCLGFGLEHSRHRVWFFCISFARFDWSW
jgi:hypothetical protein